MIRPTEAESQGIIPICSKQWTVSFSFKILFHGSNDWQGLVQIARRYIPYSLDYGYRQPTIAYNNKRKSIEFTFSGDSIMKQKGVIVEWFGPINLQTRYDMKISHLYDKNENGYFLHIDFNGDNFRRGKVENPEEWLDMEYFVGSQWQNAEGSVEVWNLFVAGVDDEK